MLAFLELGSVTVRGKQRPERIFALLGDEDVAGSDAHAALIPAHAAFLAALAAGDIAAARAHLDKCRETGGATLAGLYAGYERRLASASLAATA
ncbi:MAG: hypothetical protein WDN31_18240 [Hyphomicrobium sp.]